MNRKVFLQLLSMTGLSMGMGRLSTFAQSVQSWPDVDYVMPALFVGHGAPLYALGENKYTLAWRKLGESIPTPKAVVCISAHWLTRGVTKVTSMPKPRTIHDFGRMDDRLFEMTYPAPGSPELANAISQTVSNPHIELDHDWGYDHGTWCVLYHMFPDADIPVIQLSIDYNQDGTFHYELGKALQFLRKKGVFLIGSGNIVHNLRQLTFPETTAYDWAEEFDSQSKELLDNRNFQALVNYRKLGLAADLSIPTSDHYFPLLYTLGLAMKNDTLSYPVTGLSYGSTSMRSVLLS